MAIWDGVSNENVSERGGMSVCGSGVGCGIVEWEIRCSLRWLSHIERMENEESAKAYLSSVKGPSRRGRPLGRWEGRAKEYASEGELRGNGLKRARRECMDRERWLSFCVGATD